MSATIDGQTEEEKQTSNADTDKESPGSQNIEHANGVAMIVGTGRKRSEDDEDNGGQQEGVVTRPAIGEVAEDELADDSASKGNICDILGRG